MTTKPLKVPLAKALAALLVFGSAAPSVRAVSLDAYALGVVRLAAAAVVIGAVLVVRGELSPQAVSRWPWKTWRVFLSIGVMFGLHWLTYFLGIKWASASIGAIGFTTFGVQLPLMGWLFGFGRPTGMMWAAFLMGLVGAAMCLPDWNLRGDVMPGLALAVLSGTLYAALPLLHQRHSDLSHGLRTWAQFTFAIPVFLVVLPLARWEFQLRDVPWLIHLALVITLAGHYLWVQATTELPVQITAVLAYLVLPIAMFMAWLIVGEKITPPMIAGATLVVAGNVLVMHHHRAAARAEPVA